MNRRELFRTTVAGAAGMTLGSAEQRKDASAVQSRTKPPIEAALSDKEIYGLLGFATMTGEDPLRMWARLQATKQWLAGPLAPDAWPGQVFVADHGDIFAFRFLSLPAGWMAPSQDNQRAAYYAKQWPSWWRHWPEWWRRVGPRAWDDSYARLIWQMPDGGPEVTYEWARTESNEVVCRITHSAAADVILQGYMPWTSATPEHSVLYAEGPERRFLRGRSWIPHTRDGMRWSLALSIVPEHVVGAGSGLWHGYLPKVKTLYLAGRQGQRYEAIEESTTRWLENGRIDEVLERNRARYLKQRPIGKGWLADIPAAINDQLEWSEVYSPRRRRPYITVSRAWGGFYGTNTGPDFLWDSFFNAVLVCQEDERKSFDMIRDIVAWQNDQGMFAQYGEWAANPIPSNSPVAWGHTQYPVGALAVAKIYQRRPNRAFLDEIYPRLLKNHRWWFADRGDGQAWRDGNRNGLLELGANYPQEISYADRQQVAYCESYDDSPQWWHVAKFNEQTGTLEQDTVERNCLYAMDSWILAWMARQLGREQDAVALEAEHRRMAGNINRLLWDPRRQCYFNRHWDNHPGDPFFPHVSPDIFMSLLGKVATQEQAAALRKMFHDPTKFAGEWILPTISRDDPLYSKQDYWRGKAWAPVNWLVYQGLKIYEWDREASLLAESSAKMFLKPWRERAECHENYLSTTGEGSGDPHYTWGALLALIAVEEFVDINPWHGLRFGNLQPVDAGAIERYSIAGALYDVEMSSDGLRVNRDGKQLFATNRPVELRHVEFSSGLVSFEVRSSGAVDVRAGKDASRHFEAGVSRVSAAK